jgi:hypothetical protein
MPNDEGLDPVIQSELEGKRARLQVSLAGAVAVNPDDQAKHDRLSTFLNQPRGVIAVDPVAASKRAAIKAIADASAPHPELRSKYMEDKAFSDLAHDDSSAMSAIAGAVKRLLDPPRALPKAQGPQVLTNAQLHANIEKIRASNPALGWEEARNFAVAGNTIDNISVGLSESQRPKATLGSLVSGIGVSAIESVKGASAGFSRMAADILGLPGGAAEAKKEQDRSASRQFLGVPKVENKLGDWVYGGVNSTVQQLPGIALSVASGSPAPVLATMGLLSQGNAYGKYKDRGASTGQAVLGSSLEGGLEVATELMPMKFLTDKIGKMGVGQFVRGFLGRELASEEVNTILSNAVDTAIANPGKTWGDYFKELPEEMLATAVQTFVQTGLLTGAHVGLKRTVMRAQATDYQAQQAEQMAQGLETLQKTATASKLLDRSPVTLTAYMQDLADQGVPNIHVDSAKLVEAGVDLQKLAALVPSISGQMDQVTTGGDLVIPTAELLVNTIGTEFAQPLIDNARSGPNDMSRAEAKNHMASKGDALNAEIERVLAEKAGDDTFKEGRDALQTKLQEQLNSLGRFTPAVNKNHAMWVANFYSVMAARAGMEPQAFADRYALGFSTTSNAQGNVLEQQYGISVEGYHYSKSELSSASSAYYGTGLKGSAREANLAAKDARLRKRTSFYVDKGTGINPEAGVGGYAHRAQLSNLYDANSDPLRLRKGGQHAFESAVLDHGFSGYLDRLDGTQSGHAILLGNQTTPLEKLGPMGKTKGALVVAPAARPSLGRDKVIDALNADKTLVGGTVGRWQERLAKEHPEAFKAMTDAGVFKGDQNRQLYKSEILKEFEAKTEAPVYSQSARPDAPSIYQARAKELLVAHTPDKRSAVGFMSGSVKTPLLPTNFDIAKFFTKKHTGKLPTKKLVDALYSDALQALSESGSAVGWYDAKVKEALTTVAELHPEIETDPQAKFGFVVMLAISSNSTDVNTNFEVAESLYRSWKETGQWPTARVPDAKAADAMRDGLTLVQTLVAQRGWEAVRDFMVADHARADIEAFAGREITSELKDSRVYGAVFLGSKIGAFFNNLYGNFTPVTMDRWFMRSINRVRGGMLVLPEKFGSHLDMLSRQIAAGLDVGDAKADRIRAEIEAFKALPEAKQGDVIGVLKVLPETLVYAKTRLAAYQKGTVDSEGKRRTFSPRTAENVLAKTITEALTLDEQTPNGGEDREYLRGVMRSLQDRLHEGGIPLEMADLQAVLWYYEKDLFDLLKGKNRQSSMFGEAVQDGEDYATAARRLVERIRGTGSERAGSARPGKRPAAQRGSGQTTLFQSNNGREADGSLKGLPRNIEGFNPSVYEVATRAAEAYMANAGLPYGPPTDYVKVDKERAKHIADAFEAMKHGPQDPETKAAYQAMIDETLAQYEAILATGLVVEFNGAEDPYHGNPRNMTEDVRKNNHMWVFSTREGFGADATFDPKDSPLLAETPYKFGDQPALVNDIFRVVHDYFGHVKEGVGFRADGEENAWRAHASMYSPLARRAMTTETRGQNSWLNYGPHGDTNRTAKVEDTHFADQKIGLLPQWAVEEGSGQGTSFGQQARGQIAFSNDITQQASIISLFKNADLSTFVHESGHFFLEVHADLAGKIEARGSEATPGEQSLLADFSKTLNWLGVKPTPEQSALQVWFEMSPEQKRPLHEQWARGFEAYTFEGKAPSLELQPLFQTFRAWLVNVYRSVLKSMSANKTDIGGALDVELSDEVRGVMDRMVATSDQIAESEAARNLGPLFKSAEEAGMSMAEYQAYHDTGLQATLDATDELQARSMRDMQWLQNARSRKIKELQKQHDTLRAEVAAEVKAELMAQPVYRAWAFLTSKSDDKVLPGVASDIDPNIGAGKLRTKYLRDAYGEADDAVWRRLSELHMTSDVTGLDPDHVAEMFGFDSGDALVKALHDAEEPKHAIQGLTDTRMLQEHGDLAHPAGVERAADMAIHNEVRARFVATELKALQNAMSVREKVPGRRNTVDALAAAAKEYAYATIAKLKVRDLRPAQYAAAEVRASKAAQKSIGDTNKAAMFKRNQLINMAATKEAYAAQEEVKKAVEYFRGFDAPSKTIDPEYSQQIEALLERFDLRQSTTLKAIDKRASLLEWVQSQTEQGVEPDIPQELLNEANRKSFKEMTVDEVRGLRDTIKQIEHLGRLKNHLLTAKANRVYNEAVTEIVDSINLHANGRTADVRTPNTVLGGALLGLKNFWASHIKAATWARVMDGGKDGGPVWEYLIRTANDAGNSEVVARETATKALTVLLAPVLKEGKMGGKGVQFPTINRSLNKEARIGMYLNMGNESNFQRLLGGEGWTRQQVQPVLDAMTPAEHTFVQAVWDHFESYRPAIAAKETRIYGREPTWLVPTPLETPHGELRGGYYPVKYDPRASERAESHAEAETAKQQLAGAYTSATTRRSFTKARAEEVSGRPLLYSLDGMYNGVSEVVHDLAWHEWLIDANKLVKSKRISSAIRTQYGPEAHQQFKQWLMDNATGDRAAAGANEKALAYIRQGVSISGLGLNVMSALVQPFGITQSFVRVGPKWIGRGLVKFTGSPLETTDTIHEKSDFMRTRALTRLREISELRSQVKGRTPARAAVEASAYFLIMRAQQLVDVPTWWGAYEKAISEGNNEDRAVALSDQAVIDAQGSGGIKDQSAIERGGPAIKLFTVFYSFFNTALNLGVQKAMSSESKAKLAADYLLLYVVPVILVAAMKDALTPGDSGDWDDPEKMRKKLASEEIQYLFGLMFGVRELSGFAQAATGTAQYPTDYSGPAGVRLLTDLAKLGKQIGQGELDDGLRKSLISVGGELLRLPSAQINRTITGINALRDGDTENWGAILTGHQKPR